MRWGSASGSACVGQQCSRWTSEKIFLSPPELLLRRDLAALCPWREAVCLFFFNYKLFLGSEETKFPLCYVLWALLWGHDWTTHAWAGGQSPGPATCSYYEGCDALAPSQCWSMAKGQSRARGRARRNAGGESLAILVLLLGPGCGKMLETWDG